MKFLIYLIQNNNADSWSGITHILTDMGAYQSPGEAIAALELAHPGITDEKNIREDNREDVEINFTWFSILRLELHGFEER
jgi:hypothetical protein